MFGRQSRHTTQMLETPFLVLEQTAWDRGLWEAQGRGTAAGRAGRTEPGAAPLAGVRPRPDRE